MTTTPREMAFLLRRGLADELADLDEVEDDHNDNEWRSRDENTQAVNFRVRLDDREFLVTVEDITAPPEVRPDGPETDKGGLIGQQPY